MIPEDQRRLSDEILPAVIEAGRLILRYFERGCDVGQKADRSPVTIADREAEALLLSALSIRFPQLAIISEEAFAGGHNPALTDPFILVDPLDGTKQFVAGFNEFALNIAIVHGGRPVYGLIFAPALSDLMVTAGPGRALRARLDVRQEGLPRTLEALDPKRMTVRDRAAIATGGGVIALQSRSRNLDVSDRFLAAFKVAERRRLGSSYKFCLVACGDADLYAQLGDTCEWDTAAGEAIVQAAGGVVCDLSGQALRYGKSAVRYVNPPFYASCLPLSELPPAALPGP